VSSGAEEGLELLRGLGRRQGNEVGGVGTVRDGRGSGRGEDRLGSRVLGEQYGLYSSAGDRKKGSISLAASLLHCFSLVLPLPLALPSPPIHLLTHLLQFLPASFTPFP
jgi:hypothetical protein